MATTIPSTLKAAALKQIAFKCGISTSGTKPLLIQRLQDELPQINSANTKGSSTDAKPLQRQRFRSMGSKHILEWTIRVNMLESMLWATLKTLAEEKVWDGEVIEIAPRKVGVFWVEERGLLDGEGDKFKKGVVGSWENQNGESQNHLEMVQIGSQQVREVKERYTAKWDRKAGRAKGFKVKSKTRNNEDKEEEEEEMIPEKEEGVGKLDDLADCLLQGMAWLKWQENKKRVLEEGVEVLLEC
ncbi:hypothetical protein H4I96_05267 [Botrytis cinerea]